MQFYLMGYSISHGIKEQDMKIYPHIKLVTDAFDDFGNQTLFRMYYQKNEKTHYKAIGKVKILHASEYIVRQVIPFRFKTLNKEFCSLGQSVEYYQKLKELNNSDREWGREILLALNDIAINKDIGDKFSDQNGITNSLMRDSEAYHAYTMGFQVFHGLSNHIEGKVAFTYTYNKYYNKKVFFEFNDKSRLPNRINVVVGKNGTGKTQMLSSLASVLSGYNKMEEKYDVDVRPGFSRYIAISYSAFDNFEKPFGERVSKRQTVQEWQHILVEIQRQKDICSSRKEMDKDFNALSNFFTDVEILIGKLEEKEQLENYFNNIMLGNVLEENEFMEDGIGSYVYCGLLRGNRLISETEMYINFRNNLNEIIRMNRKKEWKVIMTNIFDNKDDLKRIFNKGKISSENVIEDYFYELSSGQKIMLHIFTQVIVSITEDSLLLIDEPEIHLHPNAISNFMRMLNDILDQFNSFAIISTHSPIVLQEIPSRYVRVFDNNEFYEDKLWEECFGDNISRIITNVFNVRPDESNYKSFFRRKKEEGFTKEEIENLFEDNLSMNAELYLNLLYEDE